MHVGSAPLLVRRVLDLQQQQQLLLWWAMPVGKVMHRQLPLAGVEGLSCQASLQLQGSGGQPGVQVVLVLLPHRQAARGRLRQAAAPVPGGEACHSGVLVL